MVDYMRFMPEDIVIMIWKKVYTMSVVHQIELNKCFSCGKFNNNSDKKNCETCILTRMPCICCGNLLFQNIEPLLEISYHDKQKIYIFNNKIFNYHNKKYISKNMLIDNLIKSNYICDKCRNINVIR